MSHHPCEDDDKIIKFQQDRHTNEYTSMSENHVVLGLLFIYY